MIKIEGQRTYTPMVLVMIAIGTTDLLFAVDSIPAVFGLTQEAYIVFAANAFALMGLRQLYFLLRGLISKLIYLSKGLAFILLFIGLKMLLEAINATFNTNLWQVPTWLSLVVIVGALSITAATSLIAVKRNPALVTHIDNAG
jgi:tellurite resistance protein TerC